MQEAGSYGYLIEARISPDALRKAQAEGTIHIRLEVDDSLPGGLAVYGERFGWRNSLKTYDLIVWVRKESTKPVKIRLSPVDN